MPLTLRILLLMTLPITGSLMNPEPSRQVPSFPPFLLSYPLHPPQRANGLSSTPWTSLEDGSPPYHKRSGLWPLENLIFFFQRGWRSTLSGGTRRRASTRLSIQRSVKEQGSCKDLFLSLGGPGEDGTVLPSTSDRLLRGCGTVPAPFGDISVLLHYCYFLGDCRSLHSLVVITNLEEAPSSSSPEAPRDAYHSWCWLSYSALHHGLLEHLFVVPAIVPNAPTSNCLPSRP